jgi:hypothetical protein
MPQGPPSLTFVVTGLPKSGTTFLQRTLSLHPQISCPSEQSFKLLADILKHALKEYRNVLTTLDRRTGGQGASEYGVSIENEMLAVTIGALSRSFARGRPINGLNDNAVFREVGLYDNLLRHPKIIGILRNPVDIALSAWRHNLRLARDEPALKGLHLAVIDNPKKTVEGYIEKMLPIYRDAVENFLAYAHSHANVLPVSYERLVSDKESELRRILAFLDAPVTDEIVAKMVASSSRDAMAASSKVPEFFGVGVKDGDRATVSREFRRQTLEASISPRMRSLGYDVPSLMLGH